MRLPSRLCGLPIRHKLTLLLLAPGLVVMMLAVAGLVALQIHIFRADYVEDLTTVAEIVAANSTAAVAFEDTTVASEILASLKGQEYVTSGILVRPDGSVMAAYGHHTAAPRVSDAASLTFHGATALMVKPVVADGKQLATLNVASNYQAFYENLFGLVGGMLVLVMFVGTGVATLLSNWLQKLVSDPILRLARTAQSVADRKDYSVRAKTETCAELGVLTRTFNLMLTRIEDQESALRDSQNKLENLIHSIHGVVWEADADSGRTLFLGQQAESMLGYPVQRWLETPRFAQSIIHPDDKDRVLDSCRRLVAEGKPFQLEYRIKAADGRLVWIRESISVKHEHGKPARLRGLIQDISDQRAAAEELERANRRLVEVSRLAGMAEIATGILHNVGNVLNSVSVSVNLVDDRLRHTKVPNLRRATAMLHGQNGNLSAFLTSDPKGKVLPEYLHSLSEHLAAEQSEMLAEVGLLAKNVEHVKEIVAMQQSYAKVSGAFEHLDPTELVEDALRINGAAFERHRVELLREYAPDLPKILVDRHKVLQILINLARNAKYALDAGRPHAKRLVVRVEKCGDDKVAIHLRDNGIGIAPEHLTRIFQHGFTTKKEGHGFGLHSGANAAKELGGRLTARSDGIGHGAEFTLELPTTRRDDGTPPTKPAAPLRKETSDTP